MLGNSASQAKQERNYGIDLLRLVAMFMVVMLHVLGHGGVFAALAPFSGNYEAAWFMEIASFCAVNCFALISGYVGVNSCFRYSSIAVLWLRVFFYSILITAFFALFVPQLLDKHAWFHALFPVMKNEYWYFTAYFCLFFLMPVFNNGIRNMTLESAKSLCFSIIAVFSVLHLIFPKAKLDVGNGYGVLWLSLMYIVGACIGKFGFMKNLSAGQSFAGYCAFVLFTWLSQISNDYFRISVGQELNGYGILVDYTSPSIVACAVFLLIAFERLCISEKQAKIVAKLAPLSFSIYLIHAQPLIWKYWLKNTFISFCELPFWIMPFFVLGAALGIYCGCLIIDFVREWLFEVLKVRKICSRLDK